MCSPVRADILVCPYKRGVNRHEPHIQFAAFALAADKPRLALTVDGATIRAPLVLDSVSLLSVSLLRFGWLLTAKGK